MSKKFTRRGFLKAAAVTAAGVAMAGVSVTGWKCLYCSTINPNGANRCGEGTSFGCGAPRPDTKNDAVEGGGSITAEPGERACKICGKNKKDDHFIELIAMFNPFRQDKAEIAWVCQHGHFEATVIDAFTGVPVFMTGPREVIPSVALFYDDWKARNGL